MEHHVGEYHLEVIGTIDDPNANSASINFKVVVITLGPIECDDLFYVLGNNPLIYAIPPPLQLPIVTPENGYNLFGITYSLRNATDGGEEIWPNFLRVIND